MWSRQLTRSKHATSKVRPVIIGPGYYVTEHLLFVSCCNLSIGLWLCRVERSKPLRFAVDFMGEEWGVEEKDSGPNDK